MVEIHDPNDDVPDVGAIVRHEGHYKSPIANVPKDRIDEEKWEYEPRYAGEVTGRSFEDGQIMVIMSVVESEDSDFFEEGDRIAISEEIINREDYYTVEE